MTSEPRVTFEQAKILKIHGFNCPTIYLYGHFDSGDLSLHSTITEENHNDSDVFISAPTISEALRFYRNKGYFIGISYEFGVDENRLSMGLCYYGKCGWDDGNDGFRTGYFYDPDHAASKLLDAIQKLNFE